VKAPRIRIAWIMVAVAIAAIDFAAMRAALRPEASLVAVLLLFGALPVANVLVVGMLIARKRPGSRPFLFGFEVFGALALALYIVAATFSGNGRGPLNRYLFLVLGPLIPFIQPNGPFVRDAIELFVGTPMLVGPQLVFALTGGFLSRRFKISVTRP
jgi:hypothetical protein